MSAQGTGVTVIVIPQPTVNGPLHIGHLSGPYLGADVASRAARARGERVQHGSMRICADVKAPQPSQDVPFDAVPQTAHFPTTYE